MSRKKSRQKREDMAPTPKGRTGSLAPWIIMGLSALVGGGILVSANLPANSGHPEPRPGITGATVIPASRYVQYARVSAVYAQAREIAPTLDGLYCHCDCSKHSGHRSLLTCFESDHGAACDICLSEASIAYTMLQNGRTLDEIRTAIDEMYGG
jgi:hypothetical protein